MRIPGPGLLEFVLGVRSLGFLDYVGGAWHRYGDTFLVRIGPKSLVLAIHPESVEHVNIGNRANYDKGPSYDGVRKYIAGDGLSPEGEYAGWVIRVPTPGTLVVMGAALAMMRRRR